MERRKVRVKENSWLARLAAKKLRYGHVAMVVGHTVHLHNTTAAGFCARRSWVLHELKHVEQYERHGMLGFLCRYLIESMRKGYRNNRFEVEARAAESDITVLERYQVVREGSSGL